MNKQDIFKMLLNKIAGISEADGDNEFKLGAICRLLKNNLPGYDWVGFYLVSKDNDHELILGPYAGEPTDHVRIAFGQGICGQAAETRETFIVDDVMAANNYLACSIHVKSEIVVPIFRGNQIIGELDIDSHEKSAFDTGDEQFLKKIGAIAANLI